MSDSVLTEIKKLLGISSEDTSFDIDLILNINSVLLTLSQLGVSIISGAEVENQSTVWSELIDPSIDLNTLFTIKMYVFAKVRKMFDPPQSGTAMQSLDALITEYEWRLNVSVDPNDVKTT